MRRGPIRPAFWLVCAWVAAIAVVVVLVLDAERNALSRAERSAAAMAQVIEEHTARTSQSVSLTLAAIADAWRLSRPAAHDAAFRGLLRERLQDLPYVRAIFVIGADGRITHDTDYPKTPTVSLADRDYFRAHREEPALKRAISTPVLSRTPGAGWFVSLTQRIGSDERFEGIVVAAMHPGYFESLYGRMRHGQDELIALFHRNGTLVARSPALPSDIGRSFTHLPLFSQLESNPVGSYTVEHGHILPGRRLVSYRTVPGWPFVVHVSYSRDAVLAGWRRSALGAAIAMTALTLLLAGVIARDVRAARRRRAQREQREQAERMEAMGALTGGIAHDFGNLLGVIGNSLHLLEAGGADARAQALGMARRAVLRGREMTDRLLTFARRKPLEPRPADLNSLLADAHPLIAQALTARIELVLQLAPGLPLALTDVSQFEMAVLNLVVNARDALGGRGRIVLRTYADAGGAPCLAVEDQGPGMPEAVRRRAMEPFFTTKGAAGTGLGLAQVYGFMHQIGGSLRIDSKPGAGTRVHLCFASTSAVPPRTPATSTPRSPSR